MSGKMSAKDNRTQNLLEKAADQMAQLDLVGKNLNKKPPGSATASGRKSADPKVNGVAARNGSTGPGARSMERRMPTKRDSSAPASGRASRKTSTGKPLESPRPEEDGPKKLPMNKIKVGNTPSPNVKEVTSKIGSLNSMSYKPQGGNVKIESKKLNWKAESKIGSMNNLTHKPGGGAVKIESKKVELGNVGSRVGSLSNVKHRPGGGDKKIFDDKEYLKKCSESSSTGRGSKTPSEGMLSPRNNTMSPTPMSPAPPTSIGK